MSLLNQSIDLATAAKAVGLAALAGGGWFAIEAKVEAKADKETVAVMANDVAHIKKAVDEIRADLKGKQDKP